MGKRNSMLNTIEGTKRYYAYQKEYRKTHTKRIGFLVRIGKDEALLKAIDALPSHGKAKNGYLKQAVTEKLIRDGYLKSEEVEASSKN